MATLRGAGIAGGLDGARGRLGVLASVCVSMVLAAGRAWLIGTTCPCAAGAFGAVGFGSDGTGIATDVDSVNTGPADVPAVLPATASAFFATVALVTGRTYVALFGKRNGLAISAARPNSCATRRLFSKR